MEQESRTVSPRGRCSSGCVPNTGGGYCVNCGQPLTRTISTAFKTKEKDVNKK